MDIYGTYSRSFYGKVWGSKQEAQLWKNLPLEKKAALISKTARPHVLQGFSSVPPQFSGWGMDTILDFHGENWPDPELANQIMSSFQQHVAVAIPKGGQWFAIHFPKTLQDPAEIVPIDPNDARDMVSFPEDWEKYVETQDMPY